MASRSENVRELAHRFGKVFSEFWEFLSQQAELHKEELMIIAVLVLVVAIFLCIAKAVWNTLCCGC